MVFRKDYNVKYFANIPVTLNRLETFDGKNLSQKFIKKLKDAFMKYSTDELARVSMGCVYLYKWCEDQVRWFSTHTLTSLCKDMNCLHSLIN